MARLVRAVAAVGLLLAALASATSTTPFKYNAAEVPTYIVTSISYSGTTHSSPLNPYGLKVVELTSTTSGEPTMTPFATGQYNRSNTQVGWDYLSINDFEGGYYGGFLEGYLTADMIMLQGIPAMPPGAVGDWIKQHVSFMQNMTVSSFTDPFWDQISSRFAYMTGIADGVNVALQGKPNAPKTPLTMMDIFLVNFVPFELGDVQIAVQVQQGQHVDLTNKIRGHCSALIKPTADDLFVAHDTWSGFEAMTYRIFKTYTFQGTTVTFSAHPGLIASGDDWYQTSNGLAVMETTNGVYNNSLYTAVVPQTVSEFLRTAVATFTATNGEQWTETFSMYNSGTYNNQYMVVDFKLYAPGSTIVPNTLWVAEQLPGYIHRADQSDVLQKQGYWSSYNVPYYKDIYALSGNLAQYQMYGDFFSYTKYARPEIFKRNQSDVYSISDMMRMMRYNNYEVDPFSKIHNCSGAPNDQCETPQTSMLSIASRGDLMKVYNTTQENINNYGPLWDYMAQGCFGAIDSKIASWKNRDTLTGWAIAGPTNDQVPTFEWNTKSCTGTPAPAQTPAVVDFPWVQFDNIGTAPF